MELSFMDERNVFDLVAYDSFWSSNMRLARVGSRGIRTGIMENAVLLHGRSNPNGFHQSDLCLVLS